MVLRVFMNYFVFIKRRNDLVKESNCGLFNYCTKSKQNQIIFKFITLMGRTYIFIGPKKKKKNRTVSDLSLSLSLSNIHTHTCAHARTHARTHTHKHTHTRALTHKPRGSRVTRLTGWRRTQAPLCFAFFCGCGLCVTVILVQLLHDVWNFNLVSPPGPFTRQNAASVHSLFCKAFCFWVSVSAIQFTCYLFLARATTRLSTGTAVCRRWAM